MTPTFRRLCLGAVVLLAVLGTGCGKKNPNKPTPVVITQSQADDLVQQVGMSASLDHGGWLVDIVSTLESMPLGATPSMSRRVLMLPASSRPHVSVNRDTVFTRASMSYHIIYYYTDTHGDSLGAWADTVTQVDGESHATGTITDTGFSAFYRHDGDPVTATGFDAGSDTISFTGVGDDSLFATFTPVFRGGTAYYSTTGFTDYDITMLRNPALNAFPIAGTANTFLFADPLRSANPTDFAGTSIEATVTITFNGTQTATLGVTNEFESASTQFRYSLDLRTGAVQRLP